MKVFTLAFVLTFSISFAHANEYIKHNGTLSLSVKNGSAKFSINASHGDASGVCNICLLYTYPSPRDP